MSNLRCTTIAIAIAIAAALAPTAVSLSDTGAGCGVVTYPQSGAEGTVHVAAGNLSCADAMSVVNRYLTDPTLSHQGNTWAAEFGGWLCASPTSAAAEAYGYSTSCTRAADEIQVRG